MRLLWNWLQGGSTVFEVSPMPHRHDQWIVPVRTNSVVRAWVRVGRHLGDATTSILNELPTHDRTRILARSGFSPDAPGKSDHAHDANQRHQLSLWGEPRR